MKRMSVSKSQVEPSLPCAVPRISEAPMTPLKSVMVAISSCGPSPWASTWTPVGLLANEDRLRVFAAVALGARTVDEIAAGSDLDTTDVQAALPRLVGA